MTCNQTEYIIISERRGENSKMFELVNKKRNDLKKNKKGFTLVEVIVVLVILAILAAILIPTMIGWSNKANKKTAIVEARSVELAAQTIVSENSNTLSGGAITSEEAAGKEIMALSEVEGTLATNIVTDAKGKVKSFTYIDSTNKYKVTYNGDEKGDKKFVITDN